MPPAQPKLTLSIDGAASVVAAFHGATGRISLGQLDAMRRVGSYLYKELKGRFFLTTKDGNSTSTGISKKALGHKEGSKKFVAYTVVGARKGFSVDAQWGKLTTSGGKIPTKTRRPNKIFHLIQYGTKDRVIKNPTALQKKRFGKNGVVRTGAMPISNAITPTYNVATSRAAEIYVEALQKALSRG